MNESPTGQVPDVQILHRPRKGVRLIGIHRLFSSVVTFTVDLTGILEAFSRLALEALNRRMAARMAGNYDEEQAWAIRYAQYIAAHENLRKLIRSLELVLKSISATIQALKLRQLQSSRRQSPNAQFVDGIVASVPVPPTNMLFSAGTYYSAACLEGR